MSLPPIGPRPHPNPPRRALREAVGQVAGIAGQVLGGLTAAVPGTVVGGLYAAEWKLPKEARHSKELGALMYAGTSVASSAGTAFLLQIPGSGMSLTNWGTAVAGSAWQYYSGGAGDVAERIYQAIDQETARPSDTPAMIGKGMLHGLVEGAKGGAHEGKMQGIGIVEGTLEGARDGWQGLQGKWDTPEAGPPDTRDKTLTRKIVEGAVGVVGGALYALDGAVQGGMRGLLGKHTLLNNQQANYKAQAALAGAVGGAVLLGPLGAVGGLMVGQWAGNLIHCAESKSLTRALDESLGNNLDLGDKQANTYRDTIEGALVGCMVGARNGMKAGSRSAQEILDTIHNPKRGQKKP
ncbi:hypothetical protein IV102_31850 [bacterium]|nr:hypothetical protein [bacterium]